MEKLFDVTFKVFGPLSVISIFAIGFYLYRKKLYSMWELRTTFYWPELISKYRSHTKTAQGHAGVWYYIAMVSIIMSMLSIFGLFSLHILLPLMKKIIGK